MNKSTIKYLFMDVDGTLTDGMIYMGLNGEILKAFHIKDGCGIHDILPSLNIIPVIITARSSRIVENRCRELGIDKYYQGCRNKTQVLEQIAEEEGYHKNVNGSYDEFAYIGDDIIDIPAMKLCSLRACPSDAVAEVKEICDFASQYSGGHGAVRELIEWIRK